MMKPVIKFYDTSSILIKEEFSPEEKIIISPYTLKELESIKKDPEKNKFIKIKANKVLHLIDDGVIDICWDNIAYSHRPYCGTTDSNILDQAIEYKKLYGDIIFYTNDIALKQVAKRELGEKYVASEEHKEDIYNGYIEVSMSDEEMATFYSNLNYNRYNLYINQYISILDKSENFIDLYYWNGKEHIKVKWHSFISGWFGEIKPKAGDIQQKMAFDCLARNQVTMLRGPAGSGKSLLSLGYLVNQLERGEIDKIIIFCNPVAVRDSAKLGYTPGSLFDKIMDTQIGNFLISKFGSREEVERLVQEQILILLSFSNIRGYDTTGLTCGIYITEAQNLSIDLMKLALQRIGDDCICILEGDDLSQVDMQAYEGDNNGMKRVSEIFRGQPFYGEVRLKTNHRSKIGKIAEDM